MTRGDWESLIQRHLDGIASPEEVEALSLRLESDEQTRLLYLRMAHVHAILAEGELESAPVPRRSPEARPSSRSSMLGRWALAMLASGDPERRRSPHPPDPLPADSRARVNLRLALSGVAAAALTVIALLAGLSLRQPDRDPVIATIASLEGSVRWTGDGGRISTDLRPGRSIGGGILETSSVDASASLRFRDGTTLSASGMTEVVLSEEGQKRWSLRRGSLSATVAPQPTGRPLIVRTPTARLEVLGTRFDLSTDGTSTRLTVTEGRVRIARASGDRGLIVPAGSWASVPLEGGAPLRVNPLRDAALAWQADLKEDLEQGEWFSAALRIRHELGLAVKAGAMTEQEAKDQYFERTAGLDEDEGSVKASPQPGGRGDSVRYVVSLSVAPGQPDPIKLVRGHSWRIRGRTEAPSEVTFGFSALEPDRRGSGRYATTRIVDGEFDLAIPLESYRLMGDRADDDDLAIGRELVIWFCFTSSKAAGLIIDGVELLPPG